MCHILIFSVFRGTSALTQARGRKTEGWRKGTTLSMEAATWKYLWFSDELIERGKDNCSDLFQHEVKNVINGKANRTSRKGKFIEMYSHPEAAIHIHRAIRLASGFCLKFCAVVERIKSF